MPRYKIQYINVYEYGDDNWDEEYENKVVFNPNDNNELPTYVQGRDPFTADFYIGREIINAEIRKDSYINDQGIPVSPEFLFSEYTVVDIKPFMSVYSGPINVRHCESLVVPQNHPDAELDLYDWPFTLMPLQASCINSDLGHSSNNPGVCTFYDESTFPNCVGYEKIKTLVIGTIDNEEVTLDRSSATNIYTYKDKNFETYKSFLEFVETKKKNFEFTYNPLIEDEPNFFASALGRMKKTYA